MSEYWKSTPKYWCKHCKIYVRDTKLEKTNHEATPKHQGNLKRFLRDLHRGQENELREKERAKREVERVSGIVAASGNGGSSSSSSMVASVSKPQATPSQRKQQLEQLAEMGVSIPDEFRGDLAMVGEWQVLEEREVGGEGMGGVEGVGVGVRKREAEKDEEDVEERVVKRGKWGSMVKSYPGEERDDGLDELLNKATTKGKGTVRPVDVKMESTADTTEVKTENGALKAEDSNSADIVKREAAEEETLDSVLATTESKSVGNVDVKQETETPNTGIVFKKRKTKNVRQK